MFFLFPGAELRGEAVHGHHGVHVATEIVKILLVEGEDDVSEVVNVRPAGISSNTLDNLYEERLSVCVHNRNQRINFSGDIDQVCDEAGGTLDRVLFWHRETRDGGLEYE